LRDLRAYSSRDVYTLKYFIVIDPPGVLLLVGDVVRTGSNYGYQYEQLAEGLMVEIVERYLGECLA
jgi:hypothetical protein